MSSSASQPSTNSLSANPRPSNPLKGWTVDRDQIEFVGVDLQRPECILAEPDGSLWTADARGGVVHIAPDGEQTVIAQQPTAGLSENASAADRMMGGTLPNGLAFDADGNIVIANFGTNAIERMTRDGESELLFDSMDGQPLGKMNFCLLDSKGRIWFTVTTRQDPWTKCINEKTPDGYVGVIDGDSIRVAADGFIGTNEIRFDADEEWLYVVETNAKRISRVRFDDDLNELEREIYGPDDLGGYPDGFAFDACGNLWITLILHERLVALTPEGEVLTLLDDGNPEAIAIYDQHFDAGTTTPDLMGACRGELAPMMASVTFGGPDLRTVYIGSLAGSRLPSFRSPVPGLPLAHWNQK